MIIQSGFTQENSWIVGSDGLAPRAANQKQVTQMMENSEIKIVQKGQKPSGLLGFNPS